MKLLRRAVRLGSWGWVTLAALSACSAPPTPDAGVPDAGDASPRAMGFVMLTQGVIGRTSTGNPIAGFSAFPRFFNAEVGCSRTDAEACSVYTCASRTLAPLPGPSNVGDLTVSNLTHPAMGPFISRVAPAGNYPQSTVSAPLWAGGDTLQFQAAGADGGAPAFSQTLTAAPVVEVTAPAFPTSGPMLVSRSSPLSLTWRATPGTTVTAFLSSVSGLGVVWAFCAWRGEAGAATIPTTVLSQLPATQLGNIVVGADARTTVVAGGWTVLLQAASAGSTDAGSAFAATELQ